MQKIIKGKLYNTETAKFIAKNLRSNCIDGSIVDNLYQKKTGELFMCVETIGFGVVYKEKIVPVNSDEFDYIFGPFDIKDWVSENCDVETYIKLFGPVSE